MLLPWRPAAAVAALEWTLSRLPGACVWDSLLPAQKSSPGPICHKRRWREPDAALWFRATRAPSNAAPYERRNPVETCESHTWTESLELELRWIEARTLRDSLTPIEHVLFPISSR
jgi:hypothetical protein